MRVKTRLFSKFITHVSCLNFHAPFTHPQTIPRACIQNGIHASKTPSTSSKYMRMWINEMYGDWYERLRNSRACCSWWLV
jgi:hypothetical protein